MVMLRDGDLTRRGWIGGAAASIGFGRPRGAWADSVLRVGDQKGGAQALLRAAGLVGHAGADLRWSLFAGAPMLIQALGAQAVDVGVIGDAPLVFAQGGAVPIHAIAGILTDGSITAVVVRHDSPVASVADLRGRRIATLKGQTGHYLTLAALRAAGLKDDDVRFVFIPPVAAKLALQTGAVDAWATWGPYISDAKVVDGAREIVNGAKLMSGMSYVVATDAALSSSRDLLRGYVRVLRDGYAWMQAHRADYAQIWARAVGLPVAVAADVVRGMAGRVVPLSAEVVARQQHVADFMADTAMVPARLRASASFADGFTF